MKKMYLDFSMRVATVSSCSYGQDGCPVPTLADIFDRVIQQSSRMDDISNDLHSEFEQYFFPTKNIIGKQRCHTYGIITPEDKENAQRLGAEQLMEVILRLLAAWTDPLSQLHGSMSQDQHEEFDHSYKKAQEVTDVVQELRDGVAKMAERMKLEGMLANTVGYISTQSLVPSAFSFYSRGEINSIDHLDLLHCFRRDSSKVRNDLRILKCTALPEIDC